MIRSMTTLLLTMTALSSHAQWSNPNNTPEGGGNPLPVVVGTASDATGDAFGLMAPNLDVSSLSANISGSNMVIRMDFSTPISSPEAGNPDSVIGFIEIDTDQDSATGDISQFDNFCPQPTDLGVEFTINLGAVNAGMVDIFDTNSTVGSAPITYTSNSFRIDLPMALIGNPSNVHMASVIGTQPEPTDCVPDNILLAAGMLNVTVPTLSQWMQILLALMFLTLTVNYIRKTNS